MAERTLADFARESAAFNTPASANGGASTTASLVDALSAALSIGGVATAIVGGKKQFPLANILTNAPFALNQTSRLFSQRAAAKQRAEQQAFQGALDAKALKDEEERLAALRGSFGDFFSGPALATSQFLSPADTSAIGKKIALEDAQIRQGISAAGGFREPAAPLPGTPVIGGPRSFTEGLTIPPPSAALDTQAQGRLTVPELPQLEPVAPPPESQRIFDEMSAQEEVQRRKRERIGQLELERRPIVLERPSIRELPEEIFTLPDVGPLAPVPAAPPSAIEQPPATEPPLPIQPDPDIEQKREMVIRVFADSASQPGGDLTQLPKHLRMAIEGPPDLVNALFDEFGLVLPSGAEQDGQRISPNVVERDGSRIFTDPTTGDTAESGVPLLPFIPEEERIRVGDTVTPPVIVEETTRLPGADLLPGDPALQLLPPESEPRIRLPRIGRGGTGVGPVIDLPRQDVQLVSSDPNQARRDEANRRRRALQGAADATPSPFRNIPPAPTVQPPEGVRTPTEDEFNRMSRGERIALVAALDEQDKQNKLEEILRGGFQVSSVSVGPDGKIRRNFARPDPAINARTVFALAVDVMNNGDKGDPFNLSDLQLRVARASNVDPSVLDDVSSQIVNATLTEFGRQIQDAQSDLPPGQQLKDSDLTRRAASRTIQHLGIGIQGLLGDVLKTLPGQDKAIGPAFAGLTPNEREAQQEEARQQGLVATAEEQAAKTSARQAAEEGRPATIGGQLAPSRRNEALRVKIADADSAIRKLRDLLGAGAQLNTRSRLAQLNVTRKKLGIAFFEDDTPDTRAIRFISDFKSGIQQFMKQLQGTLGGQVSETDAEAFAAVTPDETDSIFKIRQQAIRLLKDAISKRNALSGARPGDDEHVTIKKILATPAVFLTESFGSNEANTALEGFFK